MKQIRDFEDAVAKELADLKAKHLEQEKDEIERTKQSAETESVAIKEDFDLNEESATMKKVRQVIKKKFQ